MKKLSTIILALALVLALSVPALAAGETELKTNLSYTYIVPEPTYTVTIPGTLELNIEYTELFIEASNVDNLGNKSIYVTFERTQMERPDEGFFALELYAIGAEQQYISYGLYNAWGEFMECEYEDIIRHDTLQPGQVFAIFGENGTQMIQTYINPDWLKYVDPNVTYSGYIIFGISLRSF